MYISGIPDNLPLSSGLLLPTERPCYPESFEAAECGMVVLGRTDVI